MSIPLVPNPIPAFTGASGGDVASGFLNAFFTAQDNNRRNQAAAQQQDQFNWQKTLRPMQEQSMQLGLDAQRQNLAFGAEDQQMQRDNHAFAVAMQPLDMELKKGQVLQNKVALDASVTELQARNTDLALQQQQMNVLNNAFGFFQKVGSGMAQGSGMTGTASSYGYAGDADNGLNSLGMKRGEQPWYGKHPTVALRPETAQELGVRLPTKNADGTWNIDHSKVDVMVGGKKTTAVFDEHGMMYNPASRTKLVDLTPEASAALGLSTGTDTHGVSIVKSGAAVDQATGSPTPLGLIAAGHMLPQSVVNEGLAHYDSIKSMLPMMPNGSPQQKFALSQLAMLQMNPAFTSALQARDTQQKNAQLGNATAATMMAMPASTMAAFKVAHPQLANVDIVQNNDGTYDVMGKLNVGGRMVQAPLNPTEKAAYADALTSFSKNYKPQVLTAGSREEYSKLIGAIEAGAEADVASLNPVQAKAAYNAIAAKAALPAFLAANPALIPIHQAYMEAKPKAPMAGAANQMQMPSSQQGAQPKRFLTPEQEAAGKVGAEKQAETSRATIEVSKKLSTFAPDNGKDDASLNPALTLARKILLGLNYEGGRHQGMGSTMLSLAAGMSPTPEQLDSKASALEHVAEHNDWKLGDKAYGDVTYEQALKKWAEGIAQKYGYQFGPETAQQQAPSNITPEQSKAAASALMSTFVKRPGGQ